MRKTFRDTFRGSSQTRDWFVRLCQWLLYYYKVEVAVRGCKYIPNREVEDNIATIVSLFTEDSPKFGFILSGSVGNGKTTMVRAIQQWLNFLRRKYMPDGDGMMMASSKSIVKWAQDKSSWDFICRVPLLCIDDLGSEPAEVMDYGNANTPIVDLLEVRYSRMLFTAATTNLTPKERRERYGERIADRCRQMFENIVFKESSYR